MTIIKGAAVEQFLTGPQPHICAVLIYGPDHGLVSESAARIVKSLLNGQDDPFSLSELDPQILKSDEARLMDELLSIPFMGGRRIVRLRGLDKKTGMILQKIILDERIRQSFLVVEAGQLPKSSALRKLFEKERFLAAIACYEDDRRSLGQLLDEELIATGHTITTEARNALISYLGSDRRLSRNEIQKLCLYAGDQPRIELDDVDAVTGDISSMAIDNVIFDTGSANQSALERNLHKCFQSGTSPAAIISMALMHFTRLHSLSAQMQSGGDPSRLLAGLRPRLHFRKEAVMKQHLSYWQEPALRKALAILADAEKSTRHHTGLAETVASRALLQISLLAKPGRR